MDSTKKENLKVVLTVTANNFDKEGKVMDAISSGAKLTKADAGRMSEEDEDTITILGNDLGNPVLTADYRSISKGLGEKETEVELELKGQIFNPGKNQLVDGFAAHSKLNSVTAGLNDEQTTEEWHRLKAEKDCKSNSANVESHYTTKTRETTA